MDARPHGATRHALLLTGPPGVGKTTVVRRIVERLPGTVRPAGFYTEEIRFRGERRGFRAVTFDGKERTIEVPLVWPTPVEEVLDSLMVMVR